MEKCLSKNKHESKPTSQLAGQMDVYKLKDKGV